MRTRVYVDGFNLFYGCLSGRQHKRLDLFGLFQDHVLDQGAQVDQVLYYTADIKSSAADDPQAHARQQRYLRALQAFRPGLITVRKGFIQRSKPYLRLAADAPTVPAASAVQVFQFTEKQSDVNLAVDLISDVWRGQCEQIVLCSNDSDLAGALQAVQRDHPRIRIGVVAPIPQGGRHISSDLKRSAHWYKPLSFAHLAAGQLPAKIPGTPLTRPTEWT